MPALRVMRADHLQRVANGKQALVIERQDIPSNDCNYRKEEHVKDDSKVRYGTVSRIFHWGMAFLIGWQALKIFDRIDDGEHWVGETLVPWHVSIGTLLFVLVVLRILWAVNQKDNRPEHNPSTATLVKAGHGLMYLAILLLPIGGVLLLVGNGYGWTVFGVELIGEGDKIPWMATLGSVHSPVALFLVAMIIGHVAIALWHHFVKKDDVLRRML